MPNLEVLHVDNKRIPVWAGSLTPWAAQNGYSVPPLQHLTDLCLGDIRLSESDLAVLLAAVGPKLTKFSMRRTWLLLEAGYTYLSYSHNLASGLDSQCPSAPPSPFTIQFSTVLRALSRWRTTLTHLSFTANEPPPQHTILCRRLSDLRPVDLSELSAFTALQQLHTEVSFFADHARLGQDKNPFTSTVPESIRHLILRGTNRDLAVAVCAFTMAMAQGRYTALEEIWVIFSKESHKPDLGKATAFERVVQRWRRLRRFGPRPVMWEVLQEASRFQTWDRLADWVLLFGVRLIIAGDYQGGGSGWEEWPVFRYGDSDVG
ncbi:uncharacterized protein C8A04DRAFT_32080 [Dichotomopilus funicola]|uniref:Uncharacterized protein n=1 Tax=Dichotomopilus funicola TaxID=1934379 RepID=A0AAN6ZJ62_9PEZI|nr:hypothetical protein C8A04DRAFT_32080 [Dichotomopilus funicola]